VSGVFGQTCEDCLKVCYVVVEEDEDDDEEDTRCQYIPHQFLRVGFLSWVCFFYDRRYANSGFSSMNGCLC
jgi:hypothetical protein